jgi:hypothetical protein
LKTNLQKQLEQVEELNAELGELLKDLRLPNHLPPTPNQLHSLRQFSKEEIGIVRRGWQKTVCLRLTISDLRNAASDQSQQQGKEIIGYTKQMSEFALIKAVPVDIERLQKFEHDYELIDETFFRLLKWLELSLFGDLVTVWKRDGAKFPEESYWSHLLRSWLFAARKSIGEVSPRLAGLPYVDEVDQVTFHYASDSLRSTIDWAAAADDTGLQHRSQTKLPSSDEKIHAGEFRIPKPDPLKLMKSISPTDISPTGEPERVGEFIEPDTVQHQPPLISWKILLERMDSVFPSWLDELDESDFISIKRSGALRGSRNEWVLRHLDEGPERGAAPNYERIARTFSRQLKGVAEKDVPQRVRHSACSPIFWEMTEYQDFVNPEDWKERSQHVKALLISNPRKLTTAARELYMSLCIAYVQGHYLTTMMLARACLEISIKQNAPRLNIKLQLPTDERNKRFKDQTLEGLVRDVSKLEAYKDLTKAMDDIRVAGNRASHPSEKGKSWNAFDHHDVALSCVEDVRLVMERMYISSDC